MEYNVKIKIHKNALETLTIERCGEAADVLGYLRGAVGAARELGGTVEIVEVEYV